jgi:hypothetical protein
MRHKTFLSTAILLALMALPALAIGQNGESRAKEPNASEPTQVARRVFEGSQFWWKHRAKVEDPTRELGLGSWISRLFERVRHWIGQALKAIFRFLRSLIPSWTPKFGAAAGAGTGLLWGLGSLAVALIAWIVYRTLRRRHHSPGSLSVEELAKPERLPDALVLLGRAEAALQAGDTFEALRLGFQAILAALENRGIVRYDRARTNSEYARDLRQQPDLAAGFRRIAIPFDRAFYGKIRPDRVDVERAIEFCRSLMTAGALAT